MWLDNGATTQKPIAVIERLEHFYRHENSNIHRGAHEVAARATDAYEHARDKAADFLNASSSDEIEFTIGIEEELLLVREPDYALDPRAQELVRALGEKWAFTYTDLYAALLEFASPARRTPTEAVTDLRPLRAAAVARGAQLVGAGMHPAQRFRHVS